MRLLISGVFAFSIAHHNFHFLWAATRRQGDAHNCAARNQSIIGCAFGSIPALGRSASVAESTAGGLGVLGAGGNSEGSSAVLEGSGPRLITRLIGSERRNDSPGFWKLPTNKALGNTFVILSCDSSQTHAVARDNGARLIERKFAEIYHANRLFAARNRYRNHACLLPTSFPAGRSPSNTVPSGFLVL